MDSTSKAASTAGITLEGLLNTQNRLLQQQYENLLGQTGLPVIILPMEVSGHAYGIFMTQKYHDMLKAAMKVKED